jgi:oxygen-dependent protoporphyrinogen oxidase
MTDDTLYDNLVIGGGISGLGLAHLSLKHGLRTAVVEGADEAGGCIHSHAFPQADGFWLEMGSHTCYNSYGHLLQMVDDLGMASRLQLKGKVSFKLLEADGLASVFSRLHPLELALSLPRLFSEKKAGQSVARYYSRVLGKRNYRDLFEPAFNAVICQPAGEVPADKLFRRKPRRKDRPRSFTLAGGLSEIVRSAAAQQGLALFTGHPVTRIARDDGGFEVTLDDGRALRSRQLSLAVAPDVAARLLTEPSPDLAELLCGIAMVDIESVAAVVRREDLAMEPLAGIIAPDDAFYSAVSRDYLDHPAYRGLTFHFRPGALDEKAQERRICDVLGIGKERLVAMARRTNRLPALRVGHDVLVERIDNALAGTGMALTGNYFIGVSIEDCLTRSASEAQRLFGIPG